MFLGIQKGKVKFYTDKPLNKALYALDETIETQEEYVLEGDEYVLKDEEYLKRKLTEAKEAKKAEALSKAYDWQENGYVSYKGGKFEFSIENRSNLKDTQEALLALGEESTPWNDKDDNIIILTLDDIQYIRLNLILSAIRNIWIKDYPGYLEEIEAAKTIEEVEAIEIDYSASDEQEVEGEALKELETEASEE